LRGGNIAARLYADRLTKFLDAVDRFFGDAGRVDGTLFTRAFRLKTPAPLWTAPAFDRCLLLALIYPCATILIIWAVSGHVGPAEAALGLKPDIAGWRRGIAVGAMVIAALAARRGAALKSVTVTVAFGFAGAGAVAIAVPGAGAIAVAAVGAVVTALVVAVARAVPVSGAGAVAVAGAVAIGLGFFAYDAATVTIAIAIPIAIAIATAATLVVVFAVSIKRRWQGLFLLLFLVGMLLVCLGAAKVLSDDTIPPLMFLGLLTLINAPFDWASLGLTRALLRRGLELGGWWPYFLALADALAAAIIIAFLAVTMVVGVQAFEQLAEHVAGESRVLPLDELFDGIEAQPSAPEYWWVYTLLLSTMIPSLLNLMIGGASLLRGVPGLPALLLRFMPAGKAVPAFDRTWLALVLTCQVFVGAFLGIAAQFVLAIGVIFYVLPWVGLELLDTARVVEKFYLPMRLLWLWWGNP